MEADSEQSLAEAAARWGWSLPEVEGLTQLIKKHKKRVQDGEIPNGDLFDKVSTELNKRGFGTERTSLACASKWRRISGNQSKSRSSALLNGSNWDADFGDAGDFITVKDEVDKGPNNMIDKNQKINRPIWREEESRSLYEEIKALQELSNQGGSPKFTSATQLFNHVSALHKVKGYFRSSDACHSYWHATGRELWDYDEQIVGDFKTNDARNGKVTNSSFKANERAVEDAKKLKRITLSQISELSQIAKETLNPSMEQKEKLAKDHSISVFQVSIHSKEGNGQKRVRPGNSKRKQSGRLHAEITDGNESIVAQADDALRDIKKPRLSSFSQIAFTNDGRSAQLPLVVEEDYVRKLSASPPLPKPARLHTPNTEFIGSNDPIEINSSPLHPTKTMKDTSSSEDEAGFKEMQEMVLVQRRRIEERIAVSIDRRKQLELETIRHQTRADMEREAAEGTQKKVDEELKVEARLRTRLNEIRSL
ncbi:hypothetical protein BCON_0049g00070 [Botryotinia convoluta]|uniref:Myb-like domain-containing protein n=1 Tax=Botryotinia convoluta TaxID=54673 RepID=A0A4Z1IEE4_9HELO|nr:hypothetical protein BCON_0049g00070 [Botryotinia convoluta]